MNSDWETARRFALRRFPAGYAERYRNKGKMTTFREILISFLIGGVPTALSYFAADSDAMVRALSSLVPQDEIVWYFFVLFIMHILLFVCDWLRIYNNKSLLNLSHDIGFSLHGIYRAITGAVPTAVVIILLKEGWKGSLPITIVSSVLFVVTLVACVFLSWFQKKTKPKEKFL